MTTVTMVKIMMFFKLMFAEPAGADDVNLAIHMKTLMTRW